MNYPTETKCDLKLDDESDICLKQMIQPAPILSNRLEGVKFVLVVLSSKGMVFDLGALRQRIVQAYSDSMIFFQTSSGKALGPVAPHKVDLLIDFVGPGQRQGFFHANCLRRRARFAVGRHAGCFRKRIYDRIYDEFGNDSTCPSELLQRERYVQKQVLALAGVLFIPNAEPTSDRSKTIALELPNLQRLSGVQRF